MALISRLRRFTRSDRSSSTSSNSNSPSTSLSHTPTAPVPSTAAPLQKSSSRLHLSKTLTAFSSHKKSSSKNKLEDPEAQRRAIEEWRKKDEAEWRMPTARRPGRKSQKHQDVLRAFEWGFGAGGKRGSGGEQGGRNGSVWSGVSPGNSRVGSVDVDDGGVVGRVLSGGSRVQRVEEE